MYFVFFNLTKKEISLTLTQGILKDNKVRAASQEPITKLMS